MLDVSAKAATVMFVMWTLPFVAVAVRVASQTIRERF